MKDTIIKFADTYDGKVHEVPDPTGDGDLISRITTILNVVIGLLGIICVIVIILGGITYMTSSGESTKVQKGRNTILYGIIGLVICILAFAIVNFVIANIQS